MGEAIPLELSTGEMVYVEVSENEIDRSGRGDLERMGRVEPETRAAQRFEKALEAVKPAIGTVFRAFKELNEPSEIGLEVSLKLNAKLQTFVLTGDSEATFKLSLKWQRPE